MRCAEPESSSATCWVTCWGYLHVSWGDDLWGRIDRPPLTVLTIAERLPRGDMPMSRVTDTCHELRAPRHGRVERVVFELLVL